MNFMLPRMRSWSDGDWGPVAEDGMNMMNPRALGGDELQRGDDFAIYMLRYTVCRRNMYSIYHTVCMH